MAGLTNHLQILVLCLLLPAALAAINLTAQPFILSGQSSVSNVKLAWTAAAGATGYKVQRSINSGSYSTIATVIGNSFDDYEVQGESAAYQITATGGSSITSNTAGVTLEDLNLSSYSSYDNSQVSSLLVKPDIQLNGIYYRYNYESDANGFSGLVEQSSSDGLNFAGDRTVLTKAAVCAGSNTSGCKLERYTFIQRKDTNEVVMWAHWENNADYNLARVAVAFGLPGGAFTFGGSFRPEGKDSRDLTFFVDTDESGYLISATNTNTDTAIYSLTSDWHNVSATASTVLLGEHREAPAMIHVGDYYYLFTSTAAGWYPSPGEYISARSINGPWSTSANVGSLSTFAAQSGAIVKVGSTYAMLADRWAANWKNKEANNRQLLLPLSFSGDGTVDYHFYETVLYSSDASVNATSVAGVQRGKIVSIGRPTTGTKATAPFNATLANDGTTLVSGNYFQPSAVPFTYTVSLPSAVAVSQVDLSTRLVGGSETSYSYVIEGTNDNITYTRLLDFSANTVVGFTTGAVSGSSSYAFVRLSVSKVINVQNGNEADWAAGVIELTVYAQ